jgi:hypothetical protein
MKILVIYHWTAKNNRGTFGEYLWSFKKYAGENCYYLNTAYGIPSYLTKINFDIIIYHWSFFDPNIRMCDLSREEIRHKLTPLIDLKGYKVAIPQDEYRNSVQMKDFFHDFKIQTLFTTASGKTMEQIFPRGQSGLDHMFTVFTGYIEEDTAARVGAYYQPHKLRTIDVGYRGSSPPYWLGRAGLMKWQLTEKFLHVPVQHHLKLDLSNDGRDIFYGDDWYRFLSRCRLMLGCEGGTTLYDPDGSTRKKTDVYVLQHRGATFEETEQACFPGLDGNIDYLVLTPRTFDACMTRTCQVLIEGAYGGIIKPGVHYIEIKRDWSNIEEVIRKMEDVAYCEQLAENAYRDIVKSGSYTYQKFVQSVIEQTIKVSLVKPDNVPIKERYRKALERRLKCPWIYSPVNYMVSRLKEVAYRALLKLRLYNIYKKITFRLTQSFKHLAVKPGK